MAVRCDYCKKMLTESESNHQISRAEKEIRINGTYVGICPIYLHIECREKCKEVLK